MDPQSEHVGPGGVACDVPGGERADDWSQV